MDGAGGSGSSSGVSAAFAGSPRGGGAASVAAVRLRSSSDQGVVRLLDPALALASIASNASTLRAVCGEVRKGRKGLVLLGCSHRPQGAPQAPSSGK